MNGQVTALLKAFNDFHRPEKEQLLHAVSLTITLTSFLSHNHPDHWVPTKHTSFNFPKLLHLRSYVLLSPLDHSFLTLQMAASSQLFSFKSSSTRLSLTSECIVSSPCHFLLTFTLTYFCYVCFPLWTVTSLRASSLFWSPLFSQCSEQVPAHGRHSVNIYVWIKMPLSPLTHL